MDKDALKEKIKEKAKKASDRKIEDLFNYLSQNFSYEAREMILKGFIRGGREKESEFRNLVIDNEIESHERDFYQKVESLFYHLNS